MESNKLKNGDCVQLKHGGNNVKMTVNEIRQVSYGYLIQCKWFNVQANKFETESFAFEALKPCEDNNKTYQQK